MRVRHPVLIGVGAVALVVGALSVGPALAGTIGSSGGMRVQNSCARTTQARTFYCMSQRRMDIKEPHAVGPNVTPAGFGPADLQSAYKLSAAGGSGQTIAIVDAFNDPTAESDLATYRSQFGLPACTTANGCFRKVNQQGAASPLPPNDEGWAGEISLDLDMASAVCPNCKLLLVEASSDSGDALYLAEDFAAAHAKFVSNSWGGPEYNGETTDDVHFNHPGVAITVSSGDNGNGAQFPATSQFVTAVGGTTLRRGGGSARGFTETAWDGAGSGCSAFESKPAFQQVTTNCTRRAEADVAAVADPATGVAVFQTFGANGWAVYGGTSAAAPIIAGVYALAGTPAAGDQPAAYPYAHPANLFDVTSGNNGNCGAPQCTAGTGWDGPTGLGTPNGSAAFSVSSSDSGGSGGGSGVPTASPTASAPASPSPSPTTSPTGKPPTSPTGKPTTSPTGAPTTSPTGGATSPACKAAQVVRNNGFETNAGAPWKASTSVISDASAGETPRTGNDYAWLDGFGHIHTDTLTQSVKIPAGCNSGTLTFFMKVTTAERTRKTVFDTMTIRMGGTKLATFTNLDASRYKKHTIKMNGLAGRTLTLSFTGTEDTSLATSFILDDVFLNVSG
jgi:hypothetical protein